MSMQQRNTIVSLVIFSLILLGFSVSLLTMVLTSRFTEPNIFRLWGIVIAVAILGTIVSMIASNILYAIIHSVRTNEEPTEQDFMEDERDKLISLKGTKASNTVYSLFTLIAMLTFVLGQPPLVMFTLLIAAGIVAQIIGDIYRLARYSSGV